MSEKIKRFHESVQNALTSAPAVWTPGCPDPETLLDWIERAQAHPQAAVLLDHLMACAFCRRAYTEMYAIRTSARTPAPAQRLPSRLSRIGAWADELVSEGITTPIRSVRASLQTMDRLAASLSPAPARGLDAPADLRPAWTAVRTPQPTLRWAAVATAQECSVVVMRHTGRKTRQPLWQGSAESVRHLTLSEEAGLEAGGLYLWQVIARVAGEEAACPPVCFAVLSASARRQLEALELQAQAGTPERIALYEAFGLYDEALREVESLMPLPSKDAVLSAVRTRLLQQLSL